MKTKHNEKDKKQLKLIHVLRVTQKNFFLIFETDYIYDNILKLFSETISNRQNVKKKTLKRF